MRLGATKRTKTLVRRVTYQCFEAEADGLGVRLRAGRRSGVAQQPFVDVKRFLHTDDYAI